MRSEQQSVRRSAADNANFADAAFDSALGGFQLKNHAAGNDAALRSEEHTSELQSRLHLVCRLLLEKKKKHRRRPRPPLPGIPPGYPRPQGLVLVLRRAWRLAACTRRPGGRPPPCRCVACATAGRAP